MNKYKSILLGLALIVGIGAFVTPVKASLYQFYSERGLSFPPVSIRAESAAEVGIFGYKGTREQNILLEKRLNELEAGQNGEVIGYSVVSRYKTTLSSSMTSSQLTVPVSSITSFDGHTLTMSDLGGMVYLTVEPGTAREEIVKCTSIASSQWATCTRGLAFYGSSEASVSANQKAHNAGSVVVMSNVHYVYENLVDKDSSETASGTKRFASNELIFGDGTEIGKKKFYACDSASTSTCAYFFFSPSSTLPGFLDIGFSGDGTNELLLNSDGTVVSASSTKGAFLTNGAIGINVSSTYPLAFSSADGSLYIKDGANSGIYMDANGIAVERYDTFEWQAAHSWNSSAQFNGSVKASSTFQSTEPLTVFGTATSSTLPRIASDFISPNTAATTTITGNVEIKGDYSIIGNNVGTGIKWEYISSSACSASCTAPAGAKVAIIQETCNEAGADGYGQHMVFKTGLTTGSVSWPQISGTNSVTCYATATWSGDTITNTRTTTGADGAGSGTAYWFK